MKLKPKQRAFLAAYAVVCTIQEAARAAKVARRSHYYWLHEPEYATAFAEVKEEALDMLLAEARRRAVDGVEEPVFYQGTLCYRNEVDPKTGQMRTTNKPLTRRWYSDTLLMFLLKAERPEKYRDNWKGNVLRAGKAPPRVDLTRLSDEQREQLEGLARIVEGHSRAAEGRRGGPGGPL